jgi:non-ribosomal peptide synthetase component F
VAVAKQSDAISLAEIAAEIPGRIHQVLEPMFSSTPDHVALIDEGTSWTYRELDRSVTDIAAALKSLGIRAGDRMIIVSENCIALAALLLAASRIDAWAIVANPPLVAARTGPDPRSQWRAANVFYLGDLEGGGQSRAALWRGGMAARGLDGDRRRPDQRSG